MVNKKRKTALLKKLKRIKSYSIPQRVSKEFMDLVMEIQVMYLLAKKKPPSVTKISSIIAKNVDKRNLRSDFFR